MVLVEGDEVCCHCKEVPTTTSAAATPTSTILATTTPSGPVCSDSCLVNVSCEQQVRLCRFIFASRSYLQGH